MKEYRELKGPPWRAEVIGKLQYLSDLELQKTKWADPNYKHAFWDSLEFYIFDTLFEALDLHEKQSVLDSVGEIFYDQEEALAIHEYCKYLHDFVEDNEAGASDNYYLNHPEWPKIVAGAKEAYELMVANNEKYNFDDCLEDFNNRRIEE